MQPKNVLVVESSYISQALMSALLSTVECLVLTASDAPLALALAERCAIDLVLTSMRLRGMDGCELARELRCRAATREVPVVMVSASDSPSDMTRAREAGVLWWVRKPVNGPTLRSIVASLLAAKSAQPVPLCPVVVAGYGMRGAALPLAAADLG